MNLDLFTISPLWCRACRAPAPAHREEDEQGRQNGARRRAASSAQHKSTGRQSWPSKDVHHERENAIVD
ncbi:hypothetical protein D0B32_10685 [Paraburkholderia sp. DHOC27]|nr:hypothetical protein D0B32_10685 [Paraburkholderia sp. DHOC27]